MNEPGFEFGVRLAVSDDALKCAEIHKKSWMFALTLVKSQLNTQM